MRFFTRKKKEKLRDRIRSGTWYSKEEIKKQGSVLKDAFQALRNMNRVKDPKRKETFEQAMTRLGIDEDEIKIRQNTFMKAALIYFGFACVGIVYAVYLFARLHIFAGIQSGVLGAMLLVFAAREHFTAYQFKTRKLVGVAEWFRNLFRGGNV